MCDIYHIRSVCFFGSYKSSQICEMGNKPTFQWPSPSSKLATWNRLERWARPSPSPRCPKRTGPKRRSKRRNGDKVNPYTHMGNPWDCLVYLATLRITGNPAILRGLDVFFAGVRGISKPPVTWDPMILRVHLYINTFNREKWSKFRYYIYHTWGETKLWENMGKSSFG